MSTRRGSAFLNQFALWASLGASLYLMPFAALLVPALSIERAVLATALAALLGGLLIAAIVAQAAATHRSTAEMMTDTFGRMSRVPIAVLLLVRHLLFATFALVIIADAASLVSERAFGAELRPLWVLAFGGAALALLLAGEARVSMILRRAGVWLVLLVALAIALSAYMEFEIPSYLRRPAPGGWPSFGQAIDIMLIFPLLWLPVVADFARGTGESRPAARGAFAGVFLATLWFGVLGILYLPATDSGDIPGFVVGMGLGGGALAVIFLLQIDEPYVNARACVPAIESLRLNISATTASACGFVIAAPLAMWLNVADLEGYVLLIGALFVPAFAVLLAQALVPSRTPAPVLVAAWALGFMLYQWIAPAEIEWWRDALDTVFNALGLSFPLTSDAGQLGAAMPAFALAFGLTAVTSLAMHLIPARPRSAEPTV